MDRGLGVFLRNAAIMGVAATVAVDVWQLALRGAGVPTSNWGYVGRWIGSMPRGVFVHAAIAKSPKVRGERLIGWSFHYVVGLVYAAAYLGLLSVLGLAEPTLLSASLFGVATVVVPWLVMQPALGAGFLAAKTAKPMQARAVSLSTHLAFGLGLYFGARIVGL